MPFIAKRKNDKSLHNEDIFLSFHYEDSFPHHYHKFLLHLPVTELEMLFLIYKNCLATSHSSHHSLAKRISNILFPASRIFKFHSQRLNATLSINSAQSTSSKSSRLVGLWLVGCAGMVYGAVTVGGLTRLTESGLSMVNWDLFKTMKPPFNQADWELEFARYKQYPEYRFKSSDGEMTLGQFKFIWTMEYLHRMWGRAVGMVFLLPCAYFWARGYFNKPMKVRMVVSGLLIVSQGLIGWWMVKSGLDPSANSNSEVPRVSQYRLATHLTLAFVLYGIFLWNGLSQLFTPYDHKNVASIKSFRGMVHGNKLAVFLTIILGAFVAGLDAGLVYNSWPKFADKWMPEGLFSRQPQWRNVVDNPVTVQFLHRNMAYLTLLLVTLTWIKGRKMPLGVRSRIALHTMLAAVWIQAVLGVSTLLHHVPVSLASLHQNGALLLYSAVIWLATEIRRIPK